jgi:putative FmdB family regulatory protein
MPIFNFECKECKEKFEKLTLYSKISEVVCPKCGSANIEKKWPERIGLAFNGPGFYKTDYPKKATSAKPPKPPKE